jgi:hypothetical protein
MRLPFTLLPDEEGKELATFLFGDRELSRFASI